MLSKPQMFESNVTKQIQCYFVPFKDCQAEKKTEKYTLCTLFEIVMKQKKKPNTQKTCVLKIA